MTTATPRPPASGRPSPNGAMRPKLGRITSDQASATAARLVLNAVEGWGKTTFGAYAPNPAVLMSRGETGYVTLRQHSLVPDVDQVELTTWKDTIAQVDDLIADIGDHGAVILDALGGFERLCHEEVCRRDFGNDWGERGFGSFQKGYDVSVTEWLNLLVRLDKLRTTHNVPIVILSHSKVRPFRNPMGSDFDRYIADCHEKTWSATHKWADAVLFGTFVTVTIDDKKTKRTKGAGGDERVIYTTRRDAYDAKNRFGLPPQLAVPADPSAVWATVWSAISGKREPAGDEIPE